MNTTTLYAEADVLDHIKHVLGEESVVRLVEQDVRFADFIEHLYDTVETKSEDLRSIR